MDKYFIVSVVPNGFTIDKKGAHILNLSVCLDLDMQKLCITDDEAKQDDHAAYKARFETFYKDFDDLDSLFQPVNVAFKVAGAAHLYPLVQGNHPFVTPDTKVLRKKLWDSIFAKEKVTAAGTKITREVDTTTVIRRDMQFSEELQSVSSQLSYLNHGHGDGQTLAKFFSRTGKAADAYRKVAANKKMKMDIGIHLKLGPRSHFPADFASFKASTDLLTARERNIADYLDNYIDPDEFINTFNIINKNIALKRLLGFVIDLQVDVSTYFPVAAAKTDFQVSAGLSKPDKFVSLTSDCYRLSVGRKTAYLLNTNNVYHNDTLLRARMQKEFVELICFDKAAQDDKLKEYYTSKNRSVAARDDSFTRGIIFMHNEFNKLVEPETYNRNANGDIDETKPVNDSIFIHGHRVAVSRNDVGTYSSLTTRSIKIFTDNMQKPYYQEDPVEGCIQSDAVMHAMEQDGKVNGYTSDVMFEWNGQPLSLKSAFSRGSKSSALDKAYYSQKNPDDAAIEKSRIATQDHLSVDCYPALPKNMEGDKVNVYYGLPAGGVGQNKLRFGHQYQFVLNAEYKNGWALPLAQDPRNASQLSVSDLIADHSHMDCITSSVTFSPLENRQPPLLVPTKEIKTDDYAASDTKKENLIPAADKESLKHLIIRSETADQPGQVPAERHVLPERISLEHAYWHDLLNQLNESDALSWKYRYNCPFHTLKDYNDFVGEKDDKGLLKGNACLEGCHRYCGGTTMPDFAPELTINPTYLADPLVTGVTFRFFWDEACSDDQEIKINPHEMPFGGDLGTEPRSFRIKAMGTVRDLNADINIFKTLYTIYLKKGMNIYAYLTNSLSAAGLKHSQNRWYDTGSQNYRKTHNKTQKKAVANDGPHNPPLKIQLTHAVKTPLFRPEIDNIYTSPTRGFRVQHLPAWLIGGYDVYKVGHNVLSERAADKDHNYAPGGTFARMNFAGRFERLDAKSTGEPFLPGVNPTGALEIWMRKEEYIDDPEQLVTGRDTGTGGWDHNPEHPVESFSAPQNHFGLEHKIAFDNDIMSQLKDRAHVNLDPREPDLFRAFQTSLNLAYDIKSVKFEEREYYLRDLSKYIGYFTDTSSAQTPDDSETYALPKRENVERAPDMRFKVLVLNNQQPKKPEIAFAVTTKKETISHGDHDVFNYKQEGNIVTIYLKRGRLSSGKDERIGLPVNSVNSIYNDLFKELDMITKAGRDIVTDVYSNANVLLDPANIIIPDKENEYDARFDADLGMYHYLPKFCVERQLWKFEVVFNIKTKDTKHDMHNPFVNISLVHYQPFSVNYNAKGKFSKLADLDMDCRLSRPDSGTWCYLLPERNLNVFFDKPTIFGKKGNVRLTATFDYESLHHYQRQNDELVRTNFLCAIEGTADGADEAAVWTLIESLDQHNEIKLVHPLMPDVIPDDGIASVYVELTFDHNAYIQQQHDGTKPRVDFRNFRIRFAEVEWFTEKTWKELSVDEQADFIDNEALRVRYIELMYNG